MELTTAQAFYTDEERRHSPEWDYGVHWRGPDGREWPRWRVSWVITTGEVIAVEAAGDQRILILGTVPAIGEYPYGQSHDAWLKFRNAQTIEKLFKGWADKPRSILWVVDRLKEGAST